MKSEIIAIGDEILIGQIVDTNSTWTASRLNEMGIEVSNITAVADSKESIRESVLTAIDRSDVIIITGGLGPTNDDITKYTLAEIFGAEMVFNQSVLDNIKLLFASRGLPLNKQNRGQAMVPENCTVLNNTKGTAPGMWFSVSGKYVVSLPGVPFEMKALMEKEVLPRLGTLNHGNDIIVNKTVNVYDIPESVLAEKIEDWENNLPDNFSLAYLPSPDKIRLRLTAKGNNRVKQETEIDNLFKDLNNIIPVNLITDGDHSIEVIVNNLLKDRSITLSTAESCTGGNIAHLITTVPGSSLCFEGCVVSYSNQVKENVLGVNKEDIEKYGAVSQQVVEQMATGVRRLLDTDYSVATSGIAGPDGGTEEKPVGTVWIAVASNKRVISHKFIFSTNRERNIGKSSAKALEILIKEIKEND